MFIRICLCLYLVIILRLEFLGIFIRIRLLITKRKVYLMQQVFCHYTISDAESIVIVNIFSFFLLILPQDILGATLDGSSSYHIIPVRLMAVCQFCSKAMIHPFSLVTAITADSTDGMLQARHIIIHNRSIRLDSPYAIYFLLSAMIVTAQTKGVFAKGICYGRYYLIFQQLRTWAWVAQAAQVTDVIV